MRRYTEAQKAANKIVRKRYAEAHPDRQRRAYRANPDAFTDRTLRWMYGITLKQKRDMFAEQSGRCRVCGVDMEWRGWSKTACCVDHDHATGKVRSLLCRRCNTALGFLDESTEKIESLLSYLREYST